MRVRTRTTDYGSTAGRFTASHRDSASSEWKVESSDLWSNPTSGSLGNLVEYVEDVSTPGAKKLIRNGVIINNPMRIHSYDTRNQPAIHCHHRTTKMVDGSEVGYNWVGTVVPFAEEYGRPDLLGWLPQFAAAKAACMNDAVLRAHANVNPSELMALASIGESCKTYKFLADSSRRVLKIAHDAAHFKLRELRKQISPKELKDRYMEARYALRPLAYDVAGVLDSISAKRGSIRKTYSGSANGQSEYSDKLIGAGFWYESVCDVNRKATYTVSAKAGVLCSSDRQLADIVGLHQIPQTLWELTPLSFVVDWFAGVGTVVGAWTPKVGVNQLASWVTVKQKYVTQNTCGSLRSSADSRIWSKDNFTTGSQFSYGREELVLERFVEPALSIVPPVEIKLDRYKLLDLGIMLAQVAKRL